MQPEAVPIPPYYGEQIQCPNNGAKVVKGRRMTNSESMGMLFDDAPDIPDDFIPPLN